MTHPNDALEALDGIVKILHDCEGHQAAHLLDTIRAALTNSPPKPLNDAQTGSLIQQAEPEGTLERGAIIVTLDEKATDALLHEALRELSHLERPDTSEIYEAALYQAAKAYVQLTKSPETLVSEKQVTSVSVDPLFTCDDTPTVTADEAQDITQEDMTALAEFKRLYPSWWYKIGICDVSKDFDCAPQARSPENKYIESGEWPDQCFSYDSRISLADAIGQVMAQIAERAGR